MHIICAKNTTTDKHLFVYPILNTEDWKRNIYFVIVDYDYTKIVTPNIGRCSLNKHLINNNNNKKITGRPA